MSKVVLWEIKNNIGYITLNDPPSNKMTPDFFSAFEKMLKHNIKKSKVKAVIIHGQGRHFSSGAELKSLLNVISKKTVRIFNKAFVPSLIKSNRSAFFELSSLGIPVIAAVQGVCLGSAMELILSCDGRISTENAIFGFPETTFGLMPGLGGTCRILDYVKYSKAIELILHGETFSADEALKLGFIDKIAGRHELLAEAEVLAKKMMALYEKGNYRWKKDLLR